jgi:hypothetical protein
MALYVQGGVGGALPALEALRALENGACIIKG